MNKETLNALNLDLSKMERAVLEAGKIAGKIQEKIYPEDFSKKIEYYSEIGLIETAKIGKRIKDLKDSLKALKSSYENLNTDFTQNILPISIDDEGLISPVKIDGVAKLVLSNDMFVQQQINNEDDQKEFFEFLMDTGNSDIIKETVNSSALKSVIKKIFKANNELLNNADNKGKEIAEIEDYTEIPELVKVTPYSKVAYNKL